jgi:hypothetical protein
VHDEKYKHHVPEPTGNRNSIAQPKISHYTDPISHEFKIDVDVSYLPYPNSEIKLKSEKKIQILFQ